MYACKQMQTDAIRITFPPKKNSQSQSCFRRLLSYSWVHPSRSYISDWSLSASVCDMFRNRQTWLFLSDQAPVLHYPIFNLFCGFTNMHVFARAYQNKWWLRCAVSFNRKFLFTLGIYKLRTLGHCLPLITVQTGKGTLSLWSSKRSGNQPA